MLNVIFATPHYPKALPLAVFRCYSLRQVVHACTDCKVPVVLITVLSLRVSCNRGTQL